MFNGGFSLVELMVALAIFGVIVGLAVPSVLRRMPDYRIERVTSSATARLRTARLKAMASGAPVHIIFDQSEQSYTIWHDENRDGVMDEDEIEVHAVGDGGATFSVPFASSGFFNPGGFFETQGSLLSFLVLTVQHPNSERSDTLVIWPSGQVTMYNP